MLSPLYGECHTSGKRLQPVTQISLCQISVGKSVCNGFPERLGFRTSLEITFWAIPQQSHSRVSLSTLTTKRSAHISPLTLRSVGLVPAAPAYHPCATSTPSSSARQTFPSGLSPAVKDCFGLHGHYAFGYIAKKESGVGRKSATSVGLTTDLVHWLQAGISIAGLVRKEVEDSGLVGHVASFREPTPPVATTTARWDDIRCRKQQGVPKH